jgi:hypothetical protein
VEYLRTFERADRKFWLASGSLAPDSGSLRLTVSEGW